MPPREPAFQGTEITAAEIDRQLGAAQQAKGISPAPLVDDARFLRRATLDLTGTLPTPEAVRAFLADARPDKRARAVDALLASPAYATHWASYWDDQLMGPKARAPILDRGAFHRWLEARFAANTPWNQLVFDLVSATGQNSLGGEDARPKSAPPPDVAEREKQEGVNGAVNWLIKYRDARPDLAGATSRVFLGVQIQCAQCHDHKTEAWKQQDFRAFAAAFARTKAVPIDMKGEMMGIRRVEIRDEDRPVGLGKKKDNPEWEAIAHTRPAALDGTELGSTRRPRRALAGWLVSPQNPWFAKAIVNRYWAKLTGRGFVDPIDDFRPSNPAVMPELLDVLARDFVAHGYDLQRLLRTICLTQAYQRAPSGGTQVANGEDLWSHGRLRPMGPEELLNALMEATNIEPVLEERAEKSGKGVAQIKVQIQREFSFLFDVDEESDDDSFNGTLPQALMLLNGGLVNRAVHALPGTTLEQTLALDGDGARIELLYLRTLSRLPTDAERAGWIEFVNRGALVAQNGKGDILPEGRRGKAGRAKREAYEDLLWALLNSSEFHFNH